METFPSPASYTQFFKVDAEAQAGLEALLFSIRAGCLDTLEKYGLGSEEKARGDDITTLDKVATERLASWSERLGASLYSEEETIQRGKDLVLVADPLDGSSEIARLGFMNAPCFSTAMLMENGAILAAAGINMNNGLLYGITKNKLYHVLDGERRILHVDQERRERFFAAYARKQKRGHLLKKISEALTRGEVEYFANNGGAAYIFALTEAPERGYTAVGELLPKELWEHIPAFMATRAGAIVATREGGLLPLDIHQKATSIIAVSQEIARAFQQAVLPKR